MQDARQNIRLQGLITFFSICLFGIKLWAFFLTHSMAILTDALESTINIAAGLLGLYSLILSAKPKDKEHPYGHGKVEFLSSAVEGILIALAGVFIIVEALHHLQHPQVLHKLDYGSLLMAGSALLNFFFGVLCVRQGQKSGSPVLTAGGAHLKSDTYSTLGLLIGLLLVMYTGYAWIDALAAILFAALILFPSYRILRKAVSGMMDESDPDLINQIAVVLNEHKIPEWIDVHNMRVINYAGFYHIDCHLTVPYYYNIHEGHAVLDQLTALLQEHFKNRVEFFIHVDGCLPEQCGICNVIDCPERHAAFLERLTWTTENLLSNQKHKPIH